jgi:sugar lactone lactonase YvrE
LTPLPLWARFRTEILMSSASTIRSTTAEVVHPHRAELGEGALWDEQRQRLLSIDIVSGCVLLFTPATNELERHELGQSVGSVVLTRGSEWLLALRNGFHLYNPGTRGLHLLADPESDKPGNRFNDGKCDPRGRFWAGTMVESGPQGDAALYCYDHDHQVTRKLSGVTISNGLCWSSSEREFYYTDTPTQALQVFGFDPDTGAISEPRVVTRFEPSVGAPDGMCIDAEDHLWVALWGGGRVQRIDPKTGKVVFEVLLPVTNVTSCAFGGEHLDELYITTAKVGSSERQLQNEPQSGCLFRARLPFRGVYAKRFAGDFSA